MIYSDNMRTLSEINRDIQQCKTSINVAKTTKEALHYKALLYKLKNEKELVWNTYFERHKNMVI